MAVQYVETRHMHIASDRDSKGLGGREGTLRGIMLSFWLFPTCGATWNQQPECGDRPLPLRLKASRGWLELDLFAGFGKSVK